jgi:hypothetical protein
MNTTIVQEPQRDLQPELDSENAEMQIPDHAIRRFARFLLPRMQEDLKHQEETN